MGPAPLKCNAAPQGPDAHASAGVDSERAPPASSKASSGYLERRTTVRAPKTHQSPARGFPSPSLNTKGSRSERSEESEDPPQADRSSTRVRIAQRDGDAGETGRAPGIRRRPALPPSTRIPAPKGVDPSEARGARIRRRRTGAQPASGSRSETGTRVRRVERADGKAPGDPKITGR
jgi:hypothetical protein